MNIALPALIAMLAVAGGAQAADYSLYLVRHAEKATPSAMSDDRRSDPPLSAAGEQRAQQLARWLHDRGVESIWSSDYRRTRDTAGPLALLTGIEPALYDPARPEELAQTLQQEARTALVVGHSNTIPELATLLCRQAVAAMDDEEYDRLLVLDFSAGRCTLNTLDQAVLFKPD